MTEPFVDVHFLGRGVVFGNSDAELMESFFCYFD
jgi:hypothetical protein